MMRDFAAGCSVTSCGLAACLFWVSSITVLHRPADAAEPESGVTQLTASRMAAPEDGLVWHDSLKSGWQASKASGRPMVIFITSESCTYCDAMKQTTLCDARVQKKLLERFVPIRLRPDANNQVLSRVKIEAFPTTLVAWPRGKVIAHRVGYQPPEAFCELLNESEQATQSR